MKPIIKINMTITYGLNRIPTAPKELAPSVKTKGKVMKNNVFAGVGKPIKEVV